MLELHPPPDTHGAVGAVLLGMVQMAGDRINTTSKIPYASKVIWIERNIALPDQKLFEDLLDYADNIWVSKMHDLQNQQMEKQKKKLK